MVSKKFYSILLIIGLALVAPSTDIHPAQSQSAFQKGMTYTTWPEGQFGTPDADRALAIIPTTGSNWIALIVTQYQDELDTTEIYPTADTASDSELAHAIQQAHALGLKVMLKPQLDPLVTTATHWRGMIGQSFNEAQWQAWFTSYKNYIFHYAELAAANQVEQFCVGTELVTSSVRESDWLEIVQGVRARFSGSLTYAALHDDEVLNLSWWDAVDYIGLDAYYNLATGIDEPTVAQLKQEWSGVIASIDNLADKWDMPVLITELGYMSQDDNVQHPWNFLLEGEVDMQEQANAYQAVFESWYHQPWLEGIYWWDYGTDPFEGGPCDQRYTPHDKLAEVILRQWYGGKKPVDFIETLNSGQAHQAIYGDSLAPGWAAVMTNGVADLNANDPVYAGALAIAVEAQPGGRFSLENLPQAIDEYVWLEFYLRKTALDEKIKLSVLDGQGKVLRMLPLCRYIHSSLAPLTWSRVVVPLKDLIEPGAELSALRWENVSGVSQSFWLDEVRLLAMGERVYLGMVRR